MRALEELPRSVRAAAVGVIFDVDDTLTTHGSLTAPAFDALWAMRDAGLELVAVTGRPLGWTDAMAASWPIAVAVGENGAGWAFRAGRGLKLGYFHGAMERRAQAEHLVRVRAAVERAHPDVIEASDAEARRCDLAFDVGEQCALSPEERAALVRTIEAEGARAVVSSVHAHAIVGDWDKARGVRAAVREALGRDVASELERWVFVGDSGNDAAAFAYFPTSVGVANVREHLGRLPTPPTWITGAERGDGFVELARALIDARGPEPRA